MASMFWSANGTTVAGRLGVPPRWPAASSLRWGAFAVGSALAVGGALAYNVPVGLGIALFIAVCVAVVLRPVNILGVLIAAVFLELVKLQGVGVTRLVAPIALLVVLAAATKKETAIRWAPPLGWAIAYSVWALASGLWTESAAGTVYSLSSLAIALVYMLSFGSLITTKNELNRVLYLLAIFSLALGILSILSFTGRHPFGFTLSSEGRSAGGTGNSNYFAAIQVITFPAILVLAANEARRWWRLFLIVALLVNIGSIISTVSRGGTLSLVVVVALILLLPARSLFRSRAQKVLAVGMVLLAGTVFIYRYSADVVPRLTSVFGGSQATEAGSGRLEIWPVAWNEFKAHPVTGIGFGAFVNVSIDKILGTPASQDFELPQTKPKEVHSAYLGSLTELGIPGLFLFLGLLASTIRALRRSAKRAREVGERYLSSVANALTLSLAGWAVGSIFASSETARPRWIVVGICLALPKLIERATGEAEPAPS
jgi:O-antigen ligase